MISEFFTLLGTTIENILNTMVGQLGLSVTIIIVACLLLKLFAIDYGFIKRFIGNSILRYSSSIWSKSNRRN